ncbi:hypothetical protein DNTS_001743 [Danionella cerebrum]|uniref:SP-RING-type domain-containing protein n=1 Tax=Danionella cerebrum TaxID=2873325 RepID=A0A553MRW2_9TELE|nr:hypothetical protein DNTS_001743 [Danionella translucida]
MSTDVSEATMMLESLRVRDLSVLLSQVGERKYGLKKDLQKRAKLLLENNCTAELLSSIRALHSHCQSSRGTRRSSSVRSEEIISIPEGDGKTAKTGSAKPRMMELPFNQTLETIIPPTPLHKELVANDEGCLQQSDFSFELSVSQRDQIFSSRKSHRGSTSVQVVLRICRSRSIGVEEDQYPPDVFVLVNQMKCPVQCSFSSVKPGTEPSRPCRPIDITPLLYPRVTNKITVFWRNFGKRYSAAVYLVRVVSSQELLDQLLSSAVESLENCRRKVSEKLRSDPETEIATTGLQVSLMCPLSKQRMRVPCRARGCAHLQSFDTSSFLQMNQRTPRWSCPVCDRFLPYDELRIDSLLCEVLEDCAEDVEEVELLSDGTWRAVSQPRVCGKQGSVPLSTSKILASWERSDPAQCDVVDLTEFSSDEEEEEDFQKEDTVSTHIEAKSVLFKKSAS